MICRYCGGVMRLDDTDFNFRGNYDKYFECNDCDTSCVEITRYGKVIKEVWYSEKNGHKETRVVCIGRKGNGRIV